jgi:hypothetical protein
MTLLGVTLIVENRKIGEAFVKGKSDQETD